jgi:hypothetical protein
MSPSEAGLPLGGIQCGIRLNWAEDREGQRRRDRLTFKGQSGALRPDAFGAAGFTRTIQD